MFKKAKKTEGELKRKAEKPVWEMYEMLGEKCRRALAKPTTLCTTLERYHDGSGYKLQGVHVNIWGIDKAGRLHKALVEVISQYLNDKYNLNGIKVFGHFGLNKLSEDASGIYRVEDLDSLKNAIEECCDILNNPHVQNIQDKLSTICEKALQKYASKLKGILYTKKE
jgi:hypothetical protein